MTRIIRKVFKVDGVPTDVTSAKLSDPTDTFGVKRNDDDSVVVANNTDMTRVSAGTYEYTFSDAVAIAYTAYVEIVYEGATYHFEVDLPARTSTVVGPLSYSGLVDRIGHYLYGSAPGNDYSTDQLYQIEYCIHDGLFRVYNAHDWSFFRPLMDVTTTAPYSTGTIAIASGVVTLTGGTFPSWAASGILLVDNNYYSVSSRDSNTQLTLRDTSVTVSSGAAYRLGRPEVPMDAAFDGVAKDAELTFYHSADRWYPSATERADVTLRRLESTNPQFDTPRIFSVRTDRFDPTIGSRKSLAFYPTPNDAYTMRVPMILRPVDINESNPYPIGGEMLSQAIIEACLSAAEANYEEREHVHEKRFQEQIAMAIRNDQNRSTPSTLGDDSPEGEGRSFSVIDYSMRAREQRIGNISLDGELL